MCGYVVMMQGVLVNVGREDVKCAKSWDEKKKRYT